jgi:amino acid permease
MSNQIAQTDADAAELAHYGYEQVLERQTGTFASFAVAFAFVSIATGIFTTYGSTLITSGPLGIWTWPIVTVGQLAVALVLGALASRIPVTGYSYQWMSRLGNPLLGWIIGWISFMFLAVVVVAVDYTIASTVLPALLHYDATRELNWLVTAIVLVVQGILVATSTRSATALFTLFAAGTLLPAVIYLATVLLYIIRRGHLPETGKFNLGAWEKPVVVVALVWLVFELAIFRDASFKDAWLYIAVMVVIGAAYLAGVYRRRGRTGLAMPEMSSIDADLDRRAGRD